MGTISKNFSYREFEESDTAKARGILNVINSFSVRDEIKSLVDEVLQPLRDLCGYPLHINSGYRCKELNDAVGGVESSQHRLGQASDVRGEIKGFVPYNLAQIAYEAKLPFDQMILYPTFVHFSHRKGGKNRGQILYARTYKGRRF